MKPKQIIFKIAEFPHLSETFIVAQIVTAIKLGYEVKIIVSRLLDFGSVPAELLNKYDILNKIIVEDYQIPDKKAARLLKSFYLLALHLTKVRAIRRFYAQQKAFSLTWLYQWHFYEQFNHSNTLFHIQYGINKNPIDLLKLSGFYKPSVIVTFHGHDAFFPINGFISNDGYYDEIFYSASLITANTPYLAEKIRSLGCPDEKLKIIPVGVDTSFFFSQKKVYKRKTFEMITVGRLDAVKGHRYCIEALKIIKEKGLHVRLSIVGEGAERTNLESLIDQYELHDQVILMGRKSQEEIRQLLWEHDLYMFTAVALPDGRRETQGLATLEAQACGLPVIVFDSGGVKYTLEDQVTGFVCVEYDVQSLVQKIELLYLNPALRNKMGSDAVAFVEAHFSQNYVDSVWAKEYLRYT